MLSAKRSSFPFLGPNTAHATWTHPLRQRLTLPRRHLRRRPTRIPTMRVLPLLHTHWMMMLLLLATLRPTRRIATLHHAARLVTLMAA